MDELFSTPSTTAPETPPLSQGPVPMQRPLVTPTFSNLSIWITAGVSILVGVSILAGIGWYLNRAPRKTIQTPVPTQTPTPTPRRELSIIASQSAFQSLDTSSQALMGAIRGYIPEDPSLSPPVLDLPLGFSQ
ncbi:hypothetical protein A2973_01065 [Candidatus Gottesmanbacteria bacterium RIFCSPLOWO2_01_FULL_49_10]|uniref:Uncharacterized protein n=1 Tax=Candidatus Gottesmanbacteria bacterium RIFCSPLOWO2_01_FULL_49_10 TaxID=1798396 RepID=A0A1F6AZY6_9BACT|nr:MAG: hypothetical protein UY10_C0035G0011 [Microgenomates group bacterium GW2011_GWA2_47_8]OGG30241.1 MAG: hypothetical protein A2973_01065 [Candidatus Gottesmanbacteria bacterium RIFCSPLOWO2_01_FULL_49_10]